MLSIKCDQATPTQSWLGWLARLLWCWILVSGAYLVTRQVHPLHVNREDRNRNEPWSRSGKQVWTAWVPSLVSKCSNTHFKWWVHSETTSRMKWTIKLCDVLVFYPKVPVNTHSDSGSVGVKRWKSSGLCCLILSSSHLSLLCFLLSLKTRWHPTSFSGQTPSRSQSRGRVLTISAPEQPSDIV